MPLQPHRALYWLLALLLLAGGFPPSRMDGFVYPPTPIADAPLTPPTPVAPIPSVPFTPRPGLALAITIAPDPLAVGDIATLSVSVTNRAPYPADHLIVSAPTPDGALALPGPATLTPLTGWRWTIGQLDGNASIVVTGTLRLIRAPSGDALIASAQASADDLPTPATTTSGALVIDRTRGPVSAPFIPGHSMRLRSQDGRVIVDLPVNAAARALTLRHIPAPGAGRARPSERRVLTSFTLDATDDAGADVHQFAAPLTISVSYTSEQLAARGIRDADLQLFWFDDAAQRWQPLPTDIDAAANSASAQVDHFTTFALGDGSSASAAYIPSLQGFQVSSFTGAASASIPIDTPAGPGGLTPALDLSYSSAASDGSAGDRDNWQAGWVGKGWSLGAEGSVARNRTLAGDAWDHFTLVFAGRSFDVVRGQLTNGCTNYTNTAALDCWTWHAADDNFVRVRAVLSGGGYLWSAWTPDGTRYDFSQQLADRPDPANSNVIIQTYKWLLSQAVDPHGNKITYTYQIDPVNVGTNLWVQPTYRLSEILWGYDGATPGTGTPRYRAEFVASGPNRWVSDAHGDTTDVDLSWDYPSAPNAYWEAVTPHEQYRLNQINIQSKRAGVWELVRRYNLFYTAASDTTTPNVTTDSLGGQAVLTLKQVQRVGSDGTSVLPATSFSYYARGSAQTPAPGANRLKTIANGQGGQQTIVYQNVWTAGAFANESAYLHENYHRVTSVTTANTAGPDTSTLTTYSYTNPARNDIGYAASVVYAKNPPSGNGDSRQYLAQPEKREFRGHAVVTERHYDSATADPAKLLSIIQHTFAQGNGGSGSATCTPATPGGLLDETDACYQLMRDRAAWKGREIQTEVQTASGSVLQRTVHSFDRIDLPFFGSDASVANAAAASNNYARAGLWRSFTAEVETDAQAVEGGTPVVKTTKTFYNANCTADSATTIVAGYGNVGCILEQDGSTLVRKIQRWYALRDDSTSYLIDRPVTEALSDINGVLVGLTQSFYDGQNSSNGAIGTRGLLTRQLRYSDSPNHPGLLHGPDATYSYDAYGNRTTATTYAQAGTGQWNGSAWVYSAPGSGSIARTTTTLYDSVFHALPIQETNPLGQITKADYDDRMGTLIRVTGPNSSSDATPTDCSAASYFIPPTEETNCAVYDAFGRLSKLVKPGDTTSLPTVLATSYDSEQPFRYRVDQREVSGQAGVQIRQTYYDGLGRTIQQKREGSDGTKNIISDTAYDANGRAVAQSQPREVSQSGATFTSYTAPTTPLYRATTTSYDALDRPIRISAPDGTWSEHRYGVTGSLRYDDIVDANRHRSQQRSDALGRLVNVIEIDGNCGTSSYSWASCAAPYTTTWATAATTSYSYDALDQLTRVTDALGNRTDLTYDSLGRKLTSDDPDMGLWRYAYDANGNLARQTDARGQRICFYYDALDRLTGKHNRSDDSCPASPTLNISYSYDVGTQGKGRRTSMSVAGGASTNWSYDARGRTISATHSVPGLSGTRVLGWAYDSADRLSSVTYPNIGGVIEQISYSYDAAGRPTQLCSNRAGQACYVSGASYTALDQPDAWTLGNALAVNWSYSSPMQRLSRLTVGPGTPASVLDRGYSYDNVGNIATLSDNRSGITQSYGYDARDRLTSWTEGAGSQSYTYNALGNLLSKAGVSYTYPASGATSVRPHTPSSVGGQVYSYDANGNLTSGGARTYIWNAENLPSSITSASVSESYGYDGDGERVTKTRSGATTVYLEGLWEETVGGATDVEYTFNGQVVALRDSGSNVVTYLHSDHLGSVSVATTSSGSIASQQAFDPWGQVRPTGGTIGQTSRNYTGQRLDGTGLLYYHARMYDPVLARFVSADSVVPGAGALTVSPSDATAAALFAQGPKDRDGNPTTPRNPQTLNRYSYVTNNPLNHTDPSGHCGAGFSDNLKGVFNLSCLRMAVTIWKNTRPGTAEHAWGAAYIGLSAVGLVYGVVGAGKLAVAGGIALLGGGSAAGPTINFLEGQLNKVNHIMKEKHDWDKLVTLSGNAQQDYQAIQPFLRKVMSTAGEQIRLDGRGRPVIEWLSTINGQQVYVKGIQLGANSYQIEDAWVVK